LSKAVIGNVLSNLTAFGPKRTLTIGNVGSIFGRMAARTKIRLSRLRDIGWRHWDPIGLGGPGGSWANSGAADEYDGYLLKAAGMVRLDQGDEAAAQYLVWVESEHMGMGVRGDTHSRAAATIAAIRADDQLWRE
jgi:hypothetical protein